MRTPRGYQILKLESATPAQTMPFEQAREQISERVVHRQAPRASSRSTSTKLRAQAIIEWKNEDVKKAYEEGLAAAGQGRAPPAAPTAR